MTRRPGTSTAARDTAAQGLAAATSAFVIWGVMPLFFHLLAAASALQIVAHRVVWSCLFLLGILSFQKNLGQLPVAVTRPGVLPRLAMSTAVISINWLTFIWAIEHGRVVEISLGYFIGPLLNVLLGVIVLSERLNRAQWTSVAVAAGGVLYLTMMTGQPPWIALTLAASFGMYGLIRKTANVDALPGLTIETMMLTPFAVGYLIWGAVEGTSAWERLSGLVQVLLILAGPLTAIPLFLFAYGARRIPLSTVGILQYISPSLQLVCGVLVLGEPFDRARTVGFVLIWIALLIFAADGIWRVRRRQFGTS